MKKKEWSVLLQTPLASRSEYQVGEQVSYLVGGQRVSGEVLCVLDGPGGGQFYFVENLAQGFPDIVRASELEEPR